MPRLLQNGARTAFGVHTVLSGPRMRFVGETSKSSLWRNWNAQDGTASVLVQSAKPTGTYAESAMGMPIRAGGLASVVLGSDAATLSASIAGGVNLEAALLAAGDFAATLRLVVSLIASIGGSATVAADIFALAMAQTSLAGTSSVAASLLAKANAVASVGGSGGAEGTPGAIGHMGAAINVTGDLLTTATVGDAVMSALVEAGFDARRVLRIIAAAVAGKNGATANDFRDLSDTEDMISGTFGGGKRTGATYGGG